MSRRSSTLGALVATLPLGVLVATIGCGNGANTGSSGPSTTAASLTVATVPFETTTDPLGVVAAAADFDGGAVIFSDLGAVVINGGVVATTDASVKSWRASATIPAPDGAAPWIVGVDGAGKVWHLKGRVSLEDATDRWALTDVSVSSVASLGGSTAAFGFSGGFAYADGTHVSRFAAPEFASLVGGGGRAAAIASGSVTVFDAASTTFSSYPLPGVVAIALADDGTLLAATARTVYVERRRGALDAIYQSPDLDIHAATASGQRFWLAIGSELLTLATTDDLAPARTTGAGLTATTQLLPGMSEAVWTLDGGKLGKLSIPGEGGDAGAPTDEQVWQATISPIFGRVCASCHLPGGSAGYDLSTYSSWISLAPKIEQRVIVQGDMPPKGVTLPDADKATIADWLKKHGQ